MAGSKGNNGQRNGTATAIGPASPNGTIVASLALARQALDTDSVFLSQAQRQMAVLLWRGGGQRPVADNENPSAELAREVVNAICAHAITLIGIVARLHIDGLTFVEQGALRSLKLLERLHGHEE